jgi:alpha-D-xyloside xylohydrolase
VPWLYDDEAVDTVRFFTKLKCRLMPYLYDQAKETSETGAPLMRAMLLEFPDDPTCDQLDRQYMLGESLLVAPIFNYENVAHYYVPSGVWTDILTGRAIVGPKWVKEEHGFLSIPLLVRPNSIIALGAVDDVPSYDFANGVTFLICGLEEGGLAYCNVTISNGHYVGDATASLKDGQVSFEVRGEISNWKVVFVGRENVWEDAAIHELGSMAGPFEGASQLFGKLP